MVRVRDGEVERQSVLVLVMREVMIEVVDEIVLVVEG